VIFVDSNVPMYLVGTQHRHKVDSQRLLERLVSEQQRLVTDAEVLQEIMHRYRAINRPDAIQAAFDVLLGVVDEVFPVQREDAERARDVLLARWELSARDALHVAVMQRHRVDRIVSFDQAFDAVAGLSRLA
jgi:uncharacterized protein